MTLSAFKESIVEDAALDRFVELGYPVGNRPHLAPGEPVADRYSFSEVVLVGRLREAILRLNPTVSESRTLATLRDAPPAGLAKLLYGKLSVAGATVGLEASV